ncbi:MAG: hypothetical protein QF815_02250 [Candidatus Peribacteraceae bacterium]|jgi:hypothetical protein|nr:hypothetical protein [Candidatus Peribacteraceae bacterium]
MTDPANVTVPDETREKFGDLIELILNSESMNDEERQYWVNILPIMTPEQVENLQGILDNEKRQLAEIDRKYAPKLTDEQKKERIEKTEDKMQKQRSNREEKENVFEKKDEEDTEDLLEKIQDL